MNVVSNDTDSLITVNTLEDRLFSIGGGTLEIFMSVNFSTCWKHSIFVPHVIYSPRVALCNSINRNSATIDLYQSFFDYHRPLTLDRLSIPQSFSLSRADNANEKDPAAHYHLLDETLGIAETYALVV